CRLDGSSRSRRAISGGESRGIMQFRDCSYWLRSERNSQEIEGALLNRRGSGNDIEGGSGGGFRLNAVLGDGGQILKQGLEAVDGGAIVGAFAESLLLSTG